MALPNSLQVTCDKCKISAGCPSRGSSPLKVDGKLKAFCLLIGGYGREEVDRSILSQESLEIAEKNGFCLSIASVPRHEEGVGIIRDTIKVFSGSVTHEREKVDVYMDMVAPKSFK